MVPLAILAALLSGAPQKPGIGVVAPDFVITPVEGTPFRFAEATSTHAAVVVVFFSVVCPYSNYSDEHLRELNADYGSRGVLFVGMYSNRTEPLEEVVAHARRSQKAFPAMKDSGNKVADLLHARVTPEAFVFDREGRLRYRGRVRSKIGATDLKDALDAVLAGRPVKTPVAKAFGCAIVRE